MSYGTYEVPAGARSLTTGLAVLLLSAGSVIADRLVTRTRAVPHQGRKAP